MELRSGVIRKERVQTPSINKILILTSTFAYPKKNELEIKQDQPIMPGIKI